MKILAKLLDTFIWFFNLFFFVALVLVTVSLLALYAPSINELKKPPVLNTLFAAEMKLNKEMRSTLPSSLKSPSVSRVVTLIALLFLQFLLARLMDLVSANLRSQSVKREIEYLRTKGMNTKYEEKLVALENKIQANPEKKDRRELLKEFALIKKELEKIGNDLAFLSIDVVDSTGMKLNEDQTAVQHDFLEYINFVETKFKKFHFVKAAWTPDGVMACFRSIENAVLCAQDIIRDLVTFNKTEKMIKRDFIVRCGINAGFVYYDENTPLEQFSDRVVDIAGHMQKNAAPNTILISKNIINPVKDDGSFSEIKKTVDGLEVCEWNESKSVKQL